MERKQTKITHSRVAEVLQDSRGGEHALHGSHPADEAAGFSTVAVLAHQTSVAASERHLREYAESFLRRGKPVPCVDCGKAIPKKRLIAKGNAANRCVSCLSAAEAAGQNTPRRI